jgi:TP901 family phage tail tape measure protein
MAQSQMGEFATTGGGMSDFVDGIGTGLATVGRALTMGVSVPLAGVGVAIAKSAIDWESAFADVRKTVNITSGDVEVGFKRISDGLYAMSEAIPVSKEGLAGIAANAGQLGVAEEYILSFTRVMADLEVATNLTGEEAAAMFAQYANITGMDMGQISNLGSVIVELGNNTATTERDIAEMMHRLAGSGSIVGLTDAQIAGLGATLTSLGINAEAGGSAMSRVLSDMDSAVISNGKELKKFASIAGVSSKDFAAAWNADPISALQMFTKGLGAISDAGGDVNKALDEVGLSDVRITDMLKRLMGSGELLTDTVTMANAAWEENSALAAEAAQRYATVESKLTMLKNAVGNVATQFGNVLMPIISKAIDWATKGVKWIAGLDDGTKKLIVTVGGIAAAIGPVLLVGGKLISAFSGVIPLLALIGGGFALVYKHSDRLQAAVKHIKDSIPAWMDGMKSGYTAFTAAMQSGQGVINAAQKGLEAAFGPKVAGNVTRVLSAIQNGFKTAKAHVEAVASGVGAFIGGLIDGEGVAESLKQALAAAFGADVATRAEGVLNRINNAFAFVKTTAINFAQSAQAHFETFRTALSGVASKIAEDYSEGGVLGVLQGLGEMLHDLLQNGADLARRGAEAVREKIAEGLAMAKEWLLPKVQTWLGNLGDAYQTAKSYVVDKLPAVKNAILNGLTAAKETVVSKAQTVMTWLGDAYRSDAVQGFLGNLSGVGSTIMEKISAAKETLITKAGEMLNALGTALGSEEAKAKVTAITSVVTTIAGKITSNLGAWKTTAATLLGDLIGQLTDSGFLETTITGLGGIVTAIADGIGTAASNIVSCASTIITTLIGKFTESGFIEGLFTTAGDVVTSIAGVLGGVATNIVSAATDIGKALIKGISEIDWATVFDTAGTVITNIAGVLGGVATNIVSAATDIGKALIKGISEIDWATIFDTAGTVVTDIGAQITAVSASIYTAAADLAKALVEGIAKVDWASMVDTFGQIATGLLDNLVTAIPTVTASLTSIASSIAEGIAAIDWNGIGDSLGNIAKKLISGILDNLPATIEGVGPLVEKIGDGIVAAVSALGDAASGLISGLVEAILTPANWVKLMQLGDSICEGIAQGILHLGIDAVQLAGNLAIDVLTGIAEGVAGALTNTIVDGARALFGIEVDKELEARVHAMFDKVYTVIDAQGEQMQYSGYALMDALSAPMLTADQLTIAMQAWGVALSEGIDGAFTDAAWLGNNAVVGLFGILADKTLTEGERAKAAAVLIGAGYGDVFKNALYTSEPQVAQAAYDLIDGANTEVQAAVAALGASLPGSIQTGLESGIPILEAAANKVAEVASGAQDKVNTLADAKAVGEEAVGAVAEGQGDTGEVKKASQGVSDTITDTLEPLPGLMEELSKNGVQGMATGTLATQNEVTSAVQTVSDAAVTQALNTMSVQTGQNIGINFVRAISTGAQSMGSTLYNTIRSLGTQGVNAISGIMTEGAGSGIGRAMIQGVINGAGSMGSALNSRMRSLANSAVAAFKAALDMHSPPRVFSDIGEAIPDAVGLGADKNRDAAISSIVALAHDLEDAWNLDLDGGNVTSKPHTSSGVGSDGGGFHFHFYGDMTVRDDSDIDRISRQVYDDVVENMRGEGLVLA